MMRRITAGIAAALLVSACAEEGNDCEEKGGVKRNGLCECPEGAVLMDDRCVLGATASHDDGGADVTAIAGDGGPMDATISVPIADAGPHDVDGAVPMAVIDGGGSVQSPMKPDSGVATSRTCMPAAETCGDGKDNDCDGAVDEDCTANGCGGWNKLAHPKGEPCSVGTGACSRTGVYQCVAGRTDETSCSAGPAPEEVCDGVDNDCDGETDEGFFPNLIGDPSFEQQQQSGGVRAPWSNYKGAFISSDAHTGTKAVTVVSEAGNETVVSGWNDVFQVFPVEPNTVYKAEVWVKTSPNVMYGRLGARDAANWKIELAPDWGKAFTTLSSYTYESTLFTTGSTSTKAEVYVGVDSGNGMTTVTADDLTVTRMRCK